MQLKMKPIPGYAGYFAEESGRILSARRGKLETVAPAPDRDGYMRVRLRVAPNRRVKKTVHGLVLAAFVGPKPIGNECRHKNGVRSHNQIGNLCWGTQKENAADRDLHGTTAIGARHHNSKLTAEQVRQIKAECENYTPGLYAELADRYGVTKGAIKHVRHRRNWKHVA